MTKFNVHPDYQDFIENKLQMTKRPLWGYIDANGGGHVDPEFYVNIFDYQLSDQELEEQSLKPAPKFQGQVMYGMYAMTSEGAQFYGFGPTKVECIAHTVYQAIRMDFWGAGIGFAPLISYEELLVVGENECLPTQHIRYTSENELSELIEGMDIEEPVNQGYGDGWAIEHAPSQWDWAMSFKEAVEKIYNYIPDSWQVH